MGYKTWAPNSILTSSDVNTFLMNQAVLKFASAAERSAAVTTPSAGMASYTVDNKHFSVHDGTAWRAVPTAHNYAVGGFRLQNDGVDVPLQIKNTAGTDVHKFWNDGTITHGNVAGTTNGLLNVNLNANMRGISIRPLAGQSNDAFRYESSTGGVRFQIQSDGFTYMPYGAWIEPANTGTKGLVIKNNSGQTANSLEVQNTSNTVLFRVTPDGTYGAIGTNAVLMSGDAAGSFTPSGASGTSFKVIIDGVRYRVPVYAY